jgi:hypothetical protein
MNTSPNALVAYHFFQENREETLQEVLRHIAHQLLSHPTASSQEAVALHKKKMPRNAALLPKDLVAVICDVARTSCSSYIVLDGLDEFPHFKKLLKHLPELLGANAGVIISSRDLPSIKSQIPGAVLLGARAEHLDIELYVQWRLEEESEVEHDLLTDNLKAEIVAALVGQIDGS